MRAEHCPPLRPHLRAALPSRLGNLARALPKRFCNLGVTAGRQSCFDANGSLAVILRETFSRNTMAPCELRPAHTGGWERDRSISRAELTEERHPNLIDVRKKALCFLPARGDPGQVNLRLLLLPQSDPRIAGIALQVKDEGCQF
jgi:hypothetical protein